MAASMTSIITANVTEHLSNVWLELLLATLAAIVYFTFSDRKSPAKRPVRTAPASGEVHLLRESYEQHDGASESVAQAVRQGKLNEAISLIQRLPETVAGQMPTELAHHLLLALAKLPNMRQLPADIKVLAGKMSSNAFDAAITDLMRLKDLAACRQLHMISGLLSIQKSPKAFDLLAQAYGSDATALHVLVDEASMPLTRAFAEVAMEACTRMKDQRLTAKVLEKASTADSAFLCEVAEKATGFLKEGICSSDGPLPLGRDAATGNSKEVAMRANDIRSCGRNGDLKGAIKVFERLGGQANNALVLNSLLDACIECKDLEKAIEYFTETDCHDVISYNTMMKGYIANGQEASAKKLLGQLTQKGFSATRTSYHGLLNARVNAKDFIAAWKLVADMQAAGISPNAVTCSILLKGKMSSTSDVSRVLALVDAMEEPMDEVLFLAVVEACIRTGRLDLLSRQTERFLKQGSATSLTAPTYGSMIKAYGHARDIQRVWHLWDQMLFHSVQPTSVTLGCMVEALVANGRAADAWSLVKKMWSDETTRALVNTVIYSSILKGFAHTKETEKGMAVYEEMKAQGIQANTITYNTILNSFAQGGAMHLVAGLLEDMKAASPPVEPDIVTYSTIVKGFCNSGNLDRALKVLDDMKAVGKHIPDEVMFNSLLGGCAKEHRPDEALQLLNDMRKHKVAPSNYTLSMLVKLMGRCRRISQAFTMLEDISKEYGLKINIQVYTCLIQGCFNAGQAGRALSLHEKIIKEGLVCDSMTYTVLVRGCVQASLLDKAAELAKLAYGHGPNASKGACPGLNAGSLEELVAALGATSDEAKELMAELGDVRPASSGKGVGKGTAKGTGKGNTGYTGYTRQPMSYR